MLTSEELGRAQPCRSRGTPRWRRGGTETGNTMAADGRVRRANRGGGRRWARPPLLIALLVAASVTPAKGVWELEQLWEDDIIQYVQQFTGDVDRAGTPVESKRLRFEQTGWYQKLYDRTSVGMDKVRAALDAYAPACVNL